MIPAFVFFPPEINSALIIGGPGAGPLFEAAAAWDGLAAELSSSASSFHTTVSDLAGSAWMGPSSMSMTAAAAPYVQWLIIAAAQAEVAALQARIAALAFEGALVATVPLPQVLANRARLLVLIATNFFGINTAAIAQTELEYVEMWAQDVAAMLGYHAGAQSMAQTLPDFSVPPAALGGGSAPSADLAGLAGLVTAPLSIASQFLQGLSSLGTAFASQLQSVFGALSPAVSLLSSTPVATLTTVAQAGMYPATALMTPMVTLAQSAAPAPAAPAAAPSLAPALVGTASAPLAAPHSAGSALSDVQPLTGGGLGALGVATAGLGGARFVGSLTVPAAWQGSMPAYIATPAMSGVGSGAPVTAAAGSGGSGSGVPMAAMPVKDKAPEGEDRGTRAQVVRSRPKVVPRNRPG